MDEVRSRHVSGMSDDVRPPAGTEAAAMIAEAAMKRARKVAKSEGIEVDHAIIMVTTAPEDVSEGVEQQGIAALMAGSTDPIEAAKLLAGAARRLVESEGGQFRFELLPPEPTALSVVEERIDSVLNQLGEALGLSPDEIKHVKGRAERELVKEQS